MCPSHHARAKIPKITYWLYRSAVLSHSLDTHEMLIIAELQEAAWFLLPFFDEVGYVLRNADRRRIRMNTVMVSPEFQVVIPKDIRQLAGIRPGQKLEVFRVGGIIEMVPVDDIRSTRGSLPGLNTDVEREEDDR
jgi:AbrB family looped-hinge helix DNA binding protein